MGTSTRTRYNTAYAIHGLCAVISFLLCAATEGSVLSQTFVTALDCVLLDIVLSRPYTSSFFYFAITWIIALVRGLISHLLNI